MRKTLFVLALASSLLSGASFAADTAPPATPAASAAPVIGKEAPAFSLQDSTGKTYALSDLKGKVVVLEWINRDCPIDRRVIESKLISAVYDKYKDKVTWLAIDSTAAHTKPDYDKTISDFKLTYPVLNDAKGAVGHAYKATNTPQFFIINAEGKLVYNGAVDDDPNGSKPSRTNYVDKALAELTSGKPVSLAETKPYGCTVKYAD